jgi:hypothetical protein
MDRKAMEVLSAPAALRLVSVAFVLGGFILLTLQSSFPR